MSEPSLSSSKPLVHYRTAAEEDLPELGAMYEQLNCSYYEVGYRMPRPENIGALWVDSFRRSLGRFSNLFVAEVDGKLVGFTLCRVKRTPQTMGGVLVGEISDVWTAPEARRMGIAVSLCRMAVDWLHRQGVHSVEAQILRDNEGSAKLFEQMGFQVEYSLVRLLWDEPGSDTGHA
jgi:ribosomal protein S18 acetylase RimI-like enzyme